tara:strand:- start:4304 stop:5260 length:957 start_codon:yes stop_codon:yes gene_type:complete
MNYKESGVDIEKGDLFVEKIKGFVKETYTDQVKTAVGGFAALYDQGDRYLATGTDGVGTKLKLATELGIHDSIGIDLVAMSVNDVLCTGARPMFFLDYLATSKLDLEIHTEVVKGIAQGCLEAGCALVGGETAEMPGMYQAGEYDLAGFCVGDLPKDKIVEGNQIREGMKIYGLASSGFHSNGFSLVRELIKDEDQDLKAACLTPTKIYVKTIQNLMLENKIAGLAHITGGGLNNIKRMNDSFGYQLDNLPPMPAFMEKVLDKSALSPQELYTTFNMGIGFVFVCEELSKEIIQQFQAFELGHVTQAWSGVKVGSQLI